MVTIPLSWRKSLTWSLLAFTVTLAVTYAVTRQAEVSATVGLIERAIKLVAYPLHERLYHPEGLQSGTPEPPHSQPFLVGKNRDREASQ